MNQITLYGITGRTELGLNEYIASTPSASGMFDTAYRLLAHRTYTIQAQEDAHLFNLTEQFWGEATDHYYGDIPNDAPVEWPFPEHDDAPYAPCEHACTTLVNTYWPLDDDTPVLTFTEVTCFDIDSQPVPFEALPIGTEFYDPFTKDMVRKVSALRGLVVASDAREQPGTTYGYVDGFIPMNNTVYPVLPPTAQHLADGWVPEPLATDPPAARAAQKMVDFMDNYGTPAPLHTPPQDHPEGWNAPASPPPAEDSPETQGIPVTYKVAMGNCYRLFHHGRQIAIVPNYAQGEVIAQALAATFAGRLADFSLTLDFIEGAAP